MTAPHHRLCTLVSLAFVSALLARPAQAEPRRVISLDGQWQVAEGKLAEQPKAFDHTINVPGLLDMAAPPFETPGSTVSAADRGSPWLRPADPLREAFWHRRTFRVDGPLPAVALLKVHKARYGAKVFVNGQTVGEHGPNFTPGWFDVRPYLKGDGAENELVIRVGASLAQVPLYLTDGWDNEKSRYIPGIYDSVELILCGNPHILNAQVVPDVAKSAVRVVVELSGRGSGKVRLTVREAKSGREAGAVDAPLPPGEKLDVMIALADAHLWTPEDPFLYELTVDTWADALRTRFGMRSVATDAASGRFLLNGKPYFLRGSNVCIYRFFEDAARGALPWDENWVRALHRKFKAMHWNSLRYCIGFPPEMWYRIADEEGVLIQDEFPVWYSRAKQGWPAEIKPEHLAAEYTEWMRERWNHPCVVIWDAQNETANDEVTRAVIGMVRGLDLSDRPWDNGWGSPQRPGDISECHPYRSSGKGWTLANLVRDDGVPNNGPRKKGAAAPPYLINEYGWLWINRDGSLPTLTVEVYKRLLGENATVAERFHYYARTLAAKTELWRSRRKCAGVLHFCGLGYSRADGQTSDHFIDVPKLTYEPEFYRYVRDSFAPVGLMLDYWEPTLTPGARQTLRVMVVNDLYADCQGTVRLRLLQGEKTLAELAQPMHVAALGEAEMQFPLPVPDLRGPCTLEATLTREGVEPVRSLRDVKLARPRLNLALDRPVKASSEVRNQQGFFPAVLAVDGRADTRWSSEFKDDQWLCVELDGQPTISGVELLWQTARAARYVIEVSTDGSTWKEAARTPAQLQPVEKLEFAPVAAHFVRMRCLKRATAFGVSLHEFRVFPPQPE